MPLIAYIRGKKGGEFRTKQTNKQKCNRSKRYEINRLRPGHGHKYN